MGGRRGRAARCCGGDALCDNDHVDGVAAPAAETATRTLLLMADQEPPVPFVPTWMWASRHEALRISVEGRVVLGGGHGAPDYGGPCLAVETEPGIESVAEPLGVLE